MLFSIQELSKVSDKALPAPPSSESKMSQQVLFSENQGTDSNKQYLNIVLWMYLFTPCATRTCSRRDFGFFSMKTGEVSEVRAVSLIK